MNSSSGKKIVNRRVYHNYSLGEKFEAGIVLTGGEVKSINNGHLKLEEAFVQIRGKEAWLINAHIHPYAFADNRNYDSRRTRKLLLHQQELIKIEQKIKEKGLTLVPISCYTRHNKIKLEIALVKGKRQFEKREALKKKDLKQEVERQLKGKGN